MDLPEFSSSMIDFPTVYLDGFGDADVGFKRGQLLFLSEGRYGQLADMILSGAFLEIVEDY